MAPETMPPDPDPAADARRERDIVELVQTRVAGWPRSAFDAAPCVSPVPQLPERLGRYQIGPLIGTGGMGAVYEAVQTDLQRTVAVKIIKPGLSDASLPKRFESEARLLARLQHPGIAVIFEAGTAEGPDGPISYLAMEYVAGERLTDHAALNDLDLRDRLDLIARVCDALQHAHDRGVLHRDVKPANILVDASGQPKILDFGIARAIGQTISTGQTSWGQALGTVPYMSPEQAAGRLAEIDSRSDVYSLGVVLYELLVGMLPLSVTGRPLPEALRVICEQSPIRPALSDPSLRGDIETILLKCLEKRPCDRYATAGDLARDIRHFLSSERLEGRRPGWLLRWWRRAKPQSAVLLLALVSLCAVIGAWTLWNWATDPGVAGPAELRGARQSAQTRLPESLEHSTLIVAESFDYPTGGLAGRAGGTGSWHDAWDGETQFVDRPGLTFIDSRGKRLKVAGGAVQTAFGSASFRRINFAEQTSATWRDLVDPQTGMIGRDRTTVWIGLLADCVSEPPADEALWAACSLFRNTLGGADVLSIGKNSDGPFVWGIGGLAPGQRLQTRVPTTQPVFLVLRLQFLPGDDQLSVWLNPDLEGEPGTEAAAIHTRTRSLHFDRVRLGGCDLFQFDELRIGARFADVAPVETDLP